MRSEHATAETVAHQKNDASVLRGRWMVLVRAGWGALVLLNLGLFAAAIPALYARRSAPPEDVLARLARLGIPDDLYAVYVTALLAAFGLGCFVVATVIARRRFADPMALFVSLFLLLLGGANHPNVKALAAAHPALDPLLELSWGLLLASLVLFVFLFPDGKFVPRWMRVPAGLLILGTFVALFFGGGSLAEPPFALGPILIATLLAGTAAQIYRYRRVSSSEGRQQTKWVVFGVAAAVVGQIAGFLFAPLLARGGFPAPLYGVVDLTIVTLAYSFIPLSIGIAILRYRLWDIDLVINRTLVYGALTACVVGIYALVVGGLGALLQAHGNFLVSLPAAGLVAVLFAPLRDRLQRGVNRLMYGERDDPYAVISRLGKRLETSLASEAVLPAIAEDIARALRLPHVAIWLADGETLRLGASYGNAPPQTAVRAADAVESLRRAPDGLRTTELDPTGEYGRTLDECGTALVLPLGHRGELVGAVSMAPRGPGEDFSPADRRLLRDLATQSGAAVHAVRLTADLRSSLEDLRRSRERLVAAQEEERRRIQRDLHDGLGPVLASMRLRLEACLDAAQETEAPLSGDLERLYELVGQATANIRLLVYDLRPPVLDQLGLVPAIRQHCERFSRETGIEVGFEAEPRLSIPAAAEVTILRVVQEALVNVEKHAHASRADVRLGQRDGRLELRVRDDGVGFDAVVPGVGTGIGSMRERTELLGGTLRFASNSGTEVEALIPIAESKR